MKAIRAHVQNGQIVVDEPIELAESADVEVLVPDFGEMSVEERAEFEAEVEESAKEVLRGEVVDARSFAVGLMKS